LTKACRFAVIFVLALLAGPATMFAQTNRLASGVAVAACGELIGAVKTAPEAPPRLSDSNTDGLFNLALPYAAANGPPAKPEEFAQLAELSAQAGALARAYILSGTGENGTLTPEQRQRAEHNFIAYLPEIVRVYDFRLQVAARLAAGAALFKARMPNEASDDPAVRAGLAAIETETRAIIAAVLSLVADRNIDDQWRFDRMRLLSSDVDDFSAFLDTEPSQELADQALAAAIAEHNPKIGQLLKNFALAILR
jgi:hypothetical protein